MTQEINQGISALDMIHNEQDPYVYRQRQAEGTAPPSYPVDYKPSNEKLLVLENIKRNDNEIERRMGLKLPINPVIEDDYWRRKGRQQNIDKNVAVQLKAKELSERRMSLPAYPRSQLETFDHGTLVMLCRQYKGQIPRFDQRVGPETPASTMANWILAAQELCGVEAVDPNAPVVTPDTIDQIGLEPQALAPTDISQVPQAQAEPQDQDDLESADEQPDELPDLNTEEGIQAALAKSQGGGAEVPPDIAERFGAGAIENSVEEGAEGSPE